MVPDTEENMPTLADELRRLSNLKRTRTNFETIKEQVAELKEQTENASTVLELLTELREKADQLAGALEEVGDGNPLLQWADNVSEAIVDLLVTLPGDENGNISELVDDADEACDNYEAIQDDAGYTAQDRVDLWGPVMDALENIADAIDGKKS
jgi:DNA repair exonuclease SbcCD ATPase subunit